MKAITRDETLKQEISVFGTCFLLMAAFFVGVLVSELFLRQVVIFKFTVRFALYIVLNIWQSV